MKTLTLIAGLSALLGLGCAPPAHADEYGYLSMLHGAGIGVPAGDVWMLGLGHSICADLAGGASVYDTAAAMTQPGSPFTLFQAAEVIYASVDQLCPAFKPRAIAEVGGTGSLV